MFRLRSCARKVCVVVVVVVVIVILRSDNRLEYMLSVFSNDHL